MAATANILLVDDQPANLRALEAVLEPLAQTLVKAPSGEEALRLLLDREFAAVLLDVRMTGLGGFETAQLIRRRERNRHTPIIFLSAYEGSDFDVAKAYALGAVDYLVKPFVPEVLRAKVDVFVKLFQRAEQVRQLERRAIEHETLRRFQAVIEHSFDAVALVDADGVIRYASPSATRIGGFTPEELGGRNAFEFIHPDDVGRVRGLLDQLLQNPGGNLTATYRSRHKDGSWRWLEVTGTNLLHEPSVAAVVANYRDVTERKQAEDALQEADRRKDQFLAMLAHELRSPMAPMLHALHVLARCGEDPAAARESRAVLERQVRHMSRLVDDLLDVSRITRGKVRLQRERLDLARLARTTAEDRRPVLERAGLGLRLEVPDTPVWVMGDATRLAQVLNNLLDNAAKFTDGGTPVTVRVTSDPGTRQAIFAVRDEGMGIEPAMLPRLFEVFSQADRSLDRSRGGLGLGLALVKGLVELHGGTVAATSEGPGRGAEFTVRLPLEAEPAALSGEQRIPTRAGRRLRILVIDDNRDAATSLKALLQLGGHEVAVAYTGTEGLEVARRSPPEVVLSDIGLPGMDGFAVARELRRDPATRRARLIAITGYGSEDDQRQAREAGFEHVLTKPADPDELQRLLAE